MSKRKRKAARKAFDLNLPIVQLKISLEEIEPEIWRRIQTPDCSLDELHIIIQRCMGWDGDHLHAFEIGGRDYTVLEPGIDRHEFRDSRRLRLSKLAQQGEHSFVYEYDFGDSWRHLIEIEDTLPAAENTRYPRCVDGGRACPPEDCGGTWGYYELFEALAHPDDEQYAERLEWLGDDFDPEKFSVEEVNRELVRLRGWLGQHPRWRRQSSQFAEGDRVRVKRGVVHSQYRDLPLGGWIGIVEEIAWLIPVSYEVRWTPETLAAAHPVYAKRCRRDGERPETHWLDEAELKPADAQQPMEMEQPTDLVVRPLSAEDGDDRIRMIFGLTSDDPLPTMNEETDARYLEHLRGRLSFPFEATYWPESADDEYIEKTATVAGFAAPSSMDPDRGIRCDVQGEEEMQQVALADLLLQQEHPNCQDVLDYKYWVEDVQDSASEDEEDDENWEAEDEDDEYPDEDADEEYDYDEDEDYQDDDYDEEFADDEEASGRHLGSDDDQEPSAPQPIRRDQPPVGRNDPCPCGTGRKFKKCCLNKPKALGGE